MSYRNTNNIYPVGTIMTTKTDPYVKLVIKRYHQGLYFCAVAGEEASKELAYFEHELKRPA